MELRRQLEMVEKRLKDVYERDSHYERGKILFTGHYRKDGCSYIGYILKIFSIKTI